MFYVGVAELCSVCWALPWDAGRVLSPLPSSSPTHPACLPALLDPPRRKYRTIFKAVRPNVALY